MKKVRVKPPMRDIFERSEIETFDNGATRDISNNKLDYEGFLSPIVLERYAQYMHKHRLQTDGKFRDSDNWQMGIPIPRYMKSLLRHTMELWRFHRRGGSKIQVEETLCAILFNTMGYLLEYMKEEES